MSIECFLHLAVCYSMYDVVLCVPVLPTNGPHITGEKNQYVAGDEVDLTCTSGKSYPASELKWLVNDQEVSLAILLTAFLSQNFDLIHPRKQNSQEAFQLFLM